MGAKLHDGDISDSEDVFGHGGGLDDESQGPTACLEESTDQMRPVPSGHGAYGGARLVLRHSAHRHGGIGAHGTCRLDDDVPIGASDADESFDDPHDADRKRRRISTPTCDTGTAASGDAATGRAIRRRISVKKAASGTAYETIEAGGGCNVGVVADLSHGRPGSSSEVEMWSARAEPPTCDESRPGRFSDYAASVNVSKRAATDTCEGEEAARHCNAAKRIAAVRERVLARITEYEGSQEKAARGTSGALPAADHAGDGCNGSNDSACEAREETAPAASDEVIGETCSGSAKRRRLRGKGPMHRGHESGSFGKVHTEAIDKANVHGNAGINSTPE